MDDVINLPHSGLAAIVLAAGTSSRLGRPKQLIEWRGRPMLVHALELANEVCGSGVTAVVGAHAEQVSRVIDEGRVNIVNNANWAMGMGTSLQTGVDNLPGDVEAVLILLADQPLITRSDLAGLLALWLEQPESIAAARYNGVYGVPAIFPAAQLKKAALKGDVGARDLLLDLPISRTVAIENAGVDIDTPDDVVQLQQRR